jgi:hypothetical protein
MVTRTRPATDRRPHDPGAGAGIQRLLAVVDIGRRLSKLRASPVRNRANASALGGIF